MDPARKEIAGSWRRLYATLISTRSRARKAINGSCETFRAPRTLVRERAERAAHKELIRDTELPLQGS